MRYCIADDNALDQPLDALAVGCDCLWVFAGIKHQHSRGGIWSAYDTNFRRAEPFPCQPAAGLPASGKY
jgi:hypothetical protein